MYNMLDTVISSMRYDFIAKILLTSKTQAALRRRIDKMLYIKEVEESRQAAEKALRDELSLKTSAKKGAAGKGQEPNRDSNKKAN